MAVVHASLATINLMLAFSLFSWPARARSLVREVHGECGIVTSADAFVGVGAGIWHSVLDYGGSGDLGDDPHRGASHAPTDGHPLCPMAMHHLPRPRATSRPASTPLPLTSGEPPTGFGRPEPPRVWYRTKTEPGVVQGSR